MPATLRNPLVLEAYLEDRQENGAPPAISRHTWMIAAVTGAAAFVALLDSTVANLALIAIRDDFSSRFSTVQWVATGYLIALAVSLPCAAWLSKRVGHGRTWAGGLAVFVVASMACALAPSLDWLIAARLMQGLAAGAMVPAGQAVVGRVAEPAQLGRLFGVVGLVIALGPALGPAFAGALIDTFSWRWIFWFNVPVGILALFAARGLVPMGKHDDDRAFKPVQFVYLSGGMALCLYGTTELGLGTQGKTALPAMFLGIALLFAFIGHTRKTTEQLIDLDMLKSIHFASAVTTTGLAGANLYAGLLVIPVYLQVFAHYSASQAGLLLLVMGLGLALVMPFAGMLSDRIGGGFVTVIGGVLLVASTVPFLFPDFLSTSVLIVILAMRGAGLSCLQIPSMTSAYEVASNRKMSDATTLVNIAQRVGGAIGAAILAIVLVRFGDGPDAELESFGMAFALLTALSMSGLISAALLARHPPRVTRKEAAVKTS